MVNLEFHYCMDASDDYVNQFNNFVRPFENRL